jgi:LPS-assembly protein
MSPLDRGIKPAAKGAAAVASRTVPRDEDSRLYVGLPWGSCGLSEPRQKRVNAGAAFKAPELQPGVPVDASADRADYDRSGETLRLRGGVELTQGEQRLEADYTRYHRNSGAANAKGNVLLEYPGVRVVSETADYNMQTKVGRLDDVGYRLSDGINMRGIADSAAFLSGDVSYYQDVTFTTCPPRKGDWSIRASDLRLDPTSGSGTARNVRLRVAGVPVFYTPYLSFPIDNRRRSGFLIPMQGGGNKTGFDLILPYYWNIAPNLDMTFYPRFMSSRGMMLGAQVRGLTQAQQVEFNGQVLPRDDEKPDLGIRWSERITQSGTFGGHWSTSIDYSAVSDDQFLADFGNRLSQTSIRNLIQRGNVAYGGKGFSVLAWIQSFQTVDSTISGAYRPYTQLPHVQLDLTPGHWGPVEYRFATHFDYFDNPHRVNGSRFLLLPSVRMPLRRSYGFLIPQLRFYASGYSLANTGTDQPAQQSYAIPSLDLDSGLIFDRQTNWFGQGVLQTMEPRLYYVYTPNINQANAPLFDTTLRTFSYSSLFWPNRFTGYDRVGDENRLTVGLTSRTIGNKSGLEWLRVSLGQILYFTNRRVQLSGVDPDMTQTSSLAGELATNPAPGWLARASFQWNPNLSQNQLEQRVLQLRYTPGTDRMVSLTYRYNRGVTELLTYENTDLSFRMPIKSNVGLVGRWLYSLAQGETVEAFAGIEYSGRCCWRVRLMGRQLKTSTTSAGSTSIMLQVELAGLGSLGSRIDKLLENPNYGFYMD